MCVCPLAAVRGGVGAAGSLRDPADHQGPADTEGDGGPGAGGQPERSPPEIHGPAELSAGAQQQPALPAPEPAGPGTLRRSPMGGCQTSSIKHRADTIVDSKAVVLKMGS